MNLKACLIKNKIEFEFLAKRSTHHANEAAEASGIPLNKIVKTLVFLDEHSNPVIAIIRADYAVSRHKLERISASKSLQLAPEEIAAKVTGYPTGGIPPLGHKKRIKTFVDKHVQENANVWAGGGCRTKLVRLLVDDIVKFNESVVCDIAV